MNDKLKFKDDAPLDERAEESAEKLKPKRKQGFVIDEQTIDVPANEHDVGGEISDTNDSEGETDNIISDAENPADTENSKLYERKSNLKFTRDRPAAPVKVKKEPVKKRRKVYGITEDTTSHDNLINKPVIPLEAAKTNGDNQAAVSS